MAKAAAAGSSDEADRDQMAAADELGQLRRLLLAPEQARINEIQERLDKAELHPDQVSRVLPDAIALRSVRDNQLSKALMPTVEEAIDVSVHRNPRRLASAIFPVMGPAIRKAISQSLSEMVQSLNQVLEHSLSLKSLKWRWQAFRTGKSFGEVVIANTLLYRVEEVFLIDNRTGILLQHVAAAGAHGNDPDLISGMLTAIQDFVKESFGGKREELESIRVGELTVWVERGDMASLAAAIRGNAPIGLRDIFRDAIDSIHLEFAEPLSTFDGDTAAFEACRPHLEACLKSQKRAPKQRRATLVWVTAALILAAVGVWLFFSLRESRRWQNYLARIQSMPGIVVINEESSGGKHYVNGLRDALAVDPQTLVNEFGISGDDVVGKWESYQSSHPDLSLERARRVLEPPKTLRLELEDGVLTARGAASNEWTAQARRLVRIIPGISDLNDSEVMDLDLLMAEINELKTRVEQSGIRFATGRSELLPEHQESLQQIADDIERLMGRAGAVGQRVRIEIEGHADRTGSDQINRRLQSSRADQMANFFRARGFGREEIVKLEPDQTERKYLRMSTARVHLSDVPQSDR